MEKNQAAVSPAALDAAAEALEKFIRVLQESGGKLDAEMSRLSDSFRGEAYDQFYAAMRESRKCIEVFDEQTRFMLTQLQKDSQTLNLFKPVN